jgi:acyl-CoA synthetase (AMP-forming)/AMP-acid ligase II
MLTTYDLVWMAAERAPGHLAIVDDRSERRLTYRELMAEIDQVAAGLARRGIGQGTRVATVLPSTFDHCIAVLALARLGAVPALINFRLRPEDAASLIAEGDIASAIIGPDPDLVAAVAAALPRGAVLFASGGAVDGAEDWSACRAAPAALPPPPKPGREDEAYIFYTSGTTGLPKGVVLAQRTTEHRILWLSTQAGLRHGTHNRTLGFMPLSHAIGFYGVFLVTLALDGTYYVMSAFDPAAAVETIEREAITYLFAIPTLFHAMTRVADYRPDRMRSLELVLFGGAAIEPELINHIDQTWPATIRHIYGTTETMCSLYNPDPVPAPARLRPGFYSRTRVVELGGAPGDLVAPGEEGELIVDSDVDTIFSGYLNRPDATAEKVRDGWYYTGDIVRLEDDGDVTLMGRVDDMIRSGGESINPEDVEAALEGHAGVAECSVVGLADARWGQIVVACVVAAGDPPEAAALDAHCRAGELAPFKRPRGYVFVESLPKNAAGKVLRRLLRDAATDARDGSGTSFQTPGSTPTSE